MIKNILCTGASGFIGRHTCEALRNSSNNIISWDLKPGIIFAHQFTGHLIDPEIPEQIAQHYKEIDYIIHLAANISVPESNKQKDKYYLSNVVGTQKIIEVAKRFKVKRLVFASSCAVFGEDGEGKTLNDCKSYYAETKRMGELLLQVSDIPTVILQYYNVYGYGQKSSTGALIPNVVEKIKAGQPIDVYGDGSQIRDFVYVKDVAQANVDALTTKLEYEDGLEIFEVGTGIPTTIKDAVEEIGSQLQMPYNYNFKDKRDGDIPGFISAPNPTFNWKPKYIFKQGIAEMIKEINYDLT